MHSQTHPPLIFIRYLSLGVLCVGVAASSGNGSEMEAKRADDFLNSLGINSAVSKRGENLAHTTECVKYLGCRWIRTGYESGIPIADLVELHQQTGVRFSFGLMSGGRDISRLVAGARQLAAAEALLAIEGNNEPNNWGVTYQGERGGGTNTWMPVAALQRDLYTAVKREPVLLTYPVWSLSENGAESDNVGLQFLSIPRGAGALMPEGTRYADYANCHNYVTHPGWPGLHDNQAWVASDPTSACRVDGLYGNYGKTWRRQFAGYPESDLMTLPRVTTETGVTIDGPISEEVQACLYLNLYLDQFKRGWTHTAVYLLRDRTDEGGNQTFGFYRPDYSPRLAATYLHNLTTILSDTGWSNPPGKLDYSIPGQPATVHDLLLEKKDGRFELVLWNERFTGGADEIRVSLNSESASVQLYDPTASSSPERKFGAGATINLSMSNHPVVLEIGPRSAQGRPRPH